jgi:hypothetical protein
MNIKPKKEAIPYQKTEAGKPYGKPVTVDWKVYELDPSAVLPYGKFVGKTVSHIQANEEWYWNWIVDNNVFAAWGLLRDKPQKKLYSNYTDGTSRWVGVVEYPGTGRICPQHWLQ